MCNDDENEQTLKRTQTPRFDSSKQNSDHFQDIPVCVLLNGNLKILWCNPHSTSLFELKEKVKKEIGIPTRLQLLLYNGKVVNPKCLINLKPYENIHLLIKGKGGMQSSTTGKGEKSRRWHKNIFV